MVKTFRNPIKKNAPDPYAYKHIDDYYYFTFTTGENITLGKCKNLSKLNDADYKIVWTPPEDMPYSKALWAPEIYNFDGIWYVYFTATDDSHKNRRLYILQNKNKDVFSNTWEFKGKINIPTDRWAIDATVFKHKSRMYMIWSGWYEYSNVSQNLYIIEMESPLKVKEDRVLISEPELVWERNIADNYLLPFVNEGPAVLKKNGRIFIVYSASHFTTEYCLGMLKADEQNDLLNPSSWNKTRSPVMTKSIENKVFSPGHNSFTKSPDDKEDWIIYHAFDIEPTKGGKRRDARMQKFTWDEKGMPKFDEPVSEDMELRVPSGE